MLADGEISKEQFQDLRQKAEADLASLNEELERINAVGGESDNSLNMTAIEAALNEMLDFSGPSIDEKVLDKFVCRITPLDNTHFRWDLNLAPGPKQAIIGQVEGRRNKATVQIKEYGEDNGRPHHTYDRAIQFASTETTMFPNGKLAYFCLIAAWAAASLAIGTRKGEQDT
ncbi:hypothetical protein ADH66_01430 [Acutalibacter muris]|nr:hypothetical protein ADH66_01430 [Acutalibacter muris]